MAKKRGDGEGTVRHLKSGRWSWARMIGRDEEGKVVYDRLTADTQRELLLLVDEYKQTRSERIAQQSMPAFTTFSTAWYNRYKRNIRLSTQSSYRFTLTKLQEYWTNTPLNQITASSIIDMLTYYETIQNLSISYIKKLRSMMHQILEAAEADSYIAKNPVQHITYRFNSHKSLSNTAPKDSFTRDEISAMYRMHQDQLRDSAILTLATGIRIQELLALRGEDIAKDGSYINVNKAVNMIDGRPLLDLTKSPASIRIVPVPIHVQYVAAQYHTYGNQLIWESRRKPGQPINPSSYRSAFKSFCRAAGVRCLTPHCCRHTYVTQLRAHGVDSEVVKALVGHSRNDITEGYNHISLDVKRNAVDRISYLFGSPEEKMPSLERIF